MKRITSEGYEALQAELQRLQQIERSRIHQLIRGIRAAWTGSKIAEYCMAELEQARNEARIEALEQKLADAEVVDVSKLSGDTVGFGARVTLLDNDSYETKVWQIVGEPEADISVGRISIVSPPARALIGKKTGASVEVATPRGARIYRVLNIQYR
ncbi:MAG: transcription elongation factor GreA [Xanthobacteraceae bacterium]